MLSLIFANTGQSYAQASAFGPSHAPQKQISVDEETLKAMRLALAERDKLRTESAAKSEIIAAQDEQISALRALLQIQKTIAGEWQTAAEARKSALSIDDKLIAKYDLQITELRTERDNARGRTKWYAAGAFVFGAVLTGYMRGRD